MKFAQMAKELREFAGLSQKGLSEKIGISSSGIGHLELGQREPGSSTLLAYSKFFGVSIDELLGNEDFTPEERAAGISATRKMTVTPIEEDAVYVVRQIGKRFGEQAQRDYISVGENMLKLK